MKKVLSFALILALVLGSFSFAFGLSDVTTGDNNSEAITVCNDLGIVEGFPDGSFKPEQNVTRAEFAAMITRALAIPESALAAYSVTKFKDTSGYGWAVPYLAFCESKGIMIGDGYGNVMPGRAINVNEAITMAVRTIGYTENSSMLVGTWPGNYVTLGQTLGLYDDVANATIITRENAAQVIYNSLSVGLVTVNADGQTNAVMDGTVQKTLLTAGLGATVEDEAVINGGEASLINLMPYLGAYGVKYLNSDKKVIAVGSVASTFLTGTFDGATFTADDVDYTDCSSNAAITTGGSIFVNGKVVSGYTKLNQIVAPNAYSDGDTVTLSVKLNGKKITTYYAGLFWSTDRSGSAALFEAGDLDEDSLMNLMFTLKDKKIDLRSFKLVGVNSLGDIAVDNVVSVYTDEVTNKITKVEVGTKTVTGLVERLTSDGDIIINGTTYSEAYNAESFPTKVGDEGVLYLDVNGDGFSWDITDATSENYAMVTGVAKTGPRDTTIVLFDKAGTEKEYIVKSDVVTAPGLTPDVVVTFALDSASKVKTLKTATTTAVAAGSVLSPSRALFAGKVVDKGVVVFVKNDPGDYSIGTLANIDTDLDLVTNAWYVLDAKTGKVKVIVVDSDFAGGSDTTYGVMNVIEDASVAGDAVNYITGFADGKAFASYTDAKLVAKDKITNNDNKLCAFKVNSDGVITKITSANAITSKAAFAGVLLARTDNSVKLGNSANDFLAIDPKAVVYVYDSTADAGKVYSLGSIASLKVGNELNMVYLYQMDSNSEQYDFVIYEKSASTAVATPTIGLATGTYLLPTTVAITSAAGDNIYYSLNGAAFVAYSTPITITADATLDAKSVRAGFPDSAVTNATYTWALSGNLESLAFSGGTTILSPSFSPAVYSYTVVTSDASVTLTPSGAGIISVNGTTVVAGAASTGIAVTTAAIGTDITVILTELNKKATLYTFNVRQIL